MWFIFTLIHTYSDLGGKMNGNYLDHWFDSSCPDLTSKYSWMIWNVNCLITFNRLQSMLLILSFELTKTPSFSCFKINLRFINNKNDIEKIVIEMPSKVDPVWICCSYSAWENSIRSQLCRYLNGIFLAKTFLVVKASWFICYVLKKYARLYRSLLQSSWSSNLVGKHWTQSNSIWESLSNKRVS